MCDDDENKQTTKYHKILIIIQQKKWRKEIKQIHKSHLDLSNSTFLTSYQSTNLLKLCGFDSGVKFKLIYRASVDGFGASDFHSQCDGIPKTLTIIKVKGNSNVFGGYADVAWDSSNNFKGLIVSLYN